MLGIIGGMGPLASAEFLKTIYELNSRELEQEAPACILYSDPGIPDRTQAILNNESKVVVEHLSRALKGLSKLGATKVVIACVTMHHFLPNLPLELRANVISLLDLVVDEVSAGTNRCLLLCTQGTRQTGIFERHPRWDLIKSKVVLASDADQSSIHQLIYEKLKTNRVDDSSLCFLNELAEKYQLDCFIAGCTEIHLLTGLIRKQPFHSKPLLVVDPLFTLAKNFDRLLNE